MKRMIVFTATAMLAAVPAVAGLAGNSSLSPSVPVVSPSRAVVVDDRGGITPREDRTEVGDDRTATTGSSSPTATPSAANPPEPTDASSTDDSGQDGAGHDVGDDHGGQDGARHDVGDDHGGQDGARHDVGDDHGGHGSDG